MRQNQPRHLDPAFEYTNMLFGNMDPANRQLTDPTLRLLVKQKMLQRHFQGYLFGCLEYALTMDLWLFAQSM